MRGAEAAPEQRAALAKWLDDGKGRQIHFHWNGGTQDRDGRAGTHSAEFDKIYVDALDIDYGKLSRDQDKVIAKLRSGDVRVTTPGGTDIRFRVGDRPFNKQDGDASKARMAQARVRVDREVELPAGVVRVAPIETSANGVIVVPKARLLENAVATGIRLEFVDGKVVKATAATGAEGPRCVPGLIAGADVVPRARPGLEPEARRVAGTRPSCPTTAMATRSCASASATTPKSAAPCAAAARAGCSSTTPPSPSAATASSRTAG